MILAALALIITLCIALMAVAGMVYVIRFVKTYDA